MGRATQGVRIMNLSSDEKLVSIARLAEEDVSDDAATGEVAAASMGPADFSAAPESDGPQAPDVDDAPESDSDPDEN